MLSKNYLKQKGIAITLSVLIIFGIIASLTLTVQLISAHYQKKIRSQLCTDITALYVASQLGLNNPDQTYAIATNLQTKNCKDTSPNIQITRGFYNETQFIQDNSALANAVKITYIDPSSTIISNHSHIEIPIKSVSIAINPNPAKSKTSYLIK